MVIAPTVGDSAVYECAVSNEAGVDSRFINLTVHGEGRKTWLESCNRGEDLFLHTVCINVICSSSSSIHSR